ncbi:MAG: DUF3035 domain-containing protein [Alphaproteobacteria bacterium]
MKKVILILTVVFALGACSRLTREDVGLAKSKPDETKILTQKELVLPPDFDTIPVSSGTQQ